MTNQASSEDAMNDATKTTWRPVKLQRLDLYSVERDTAVKGFTDVAYLSLGVSKHEAKRVAAYLNRLEALAGLAEPAWGIIANVSNGNWRKVLGRDFFKAGMIVDPAIISETWWFVVDETDIMQAICVFESHADRILEMRGFWLTYHADHAQAGEAQRLRTALEVQRRHWQHVMDAPEHQGVNKSPILFAGSIKIEAEIALEGIRDALTPRAGQEPS